MTVLGISSEELHIILCEILKSETSLEQKLNEELNIFYVWQNFRIIREIEV